MLRLGEVDVAICGGVSESIHTFGIFAGFKSQNALAVHDDPLKASRPFDLARNGIVVSEGGCLYTLERLEANGAVTALVDKRRVSGAKLSYSPDEDKYVVTGAPVKMIDADCQETSGKTLTFWKASDRVLVDGNNEVRTQTKGGGKCVATPPQ